MFIHPNVTMTMFSMFSCLPIFGYTKPWLKIDVRYQCLDRSWFMFCIVSVTVIMVFTLGLPLIYAVILRQRRHLLVESRQVTMAPSSSPC